jgi:hypothetical protein
MQSHDFTLARPDGPFLLRLIYEAASACVLHALTAPCNIMPYACMVTTASLRAGKKERRLVVVRCLEGGGRRRMDGSWMEEAKAKARQLNW